jgi:feruloyl esterase
MQLHLIRRWVWALAIAATGAILAESAGGAVQAVPLGAQVQGAGGSCKNLAALILPHTAITTAQPVAAADGLPAYCRVAMTSKPSSDSDIKIEVWLPAAGWNGKFQAVGNGGWNGSIDRNALTAGLRRDYATASTDTGHEGGGGPWMQSAEKLIDFGYRAVHEMTVSGKAIAAAYYGSNATRSYFTGCSAGGRQGLKAAQRFPDDFDGIVAGAPALNTTGRAAFSMWIAQHQHRDEASFIPAAKYPAIHDAVLQACDALDGVSDRVVENPRQCKFDPAVIECKAGDAPTCLTPAQVATARTMYQPVVNPRTKQSIFPGLEYGSEMGWSTFGGPQPFGIGSQMYQFMVFNDPGWNYQTLNFDGHMAIVDRIENGAINAMDPNLKPFIASGGKLIQYHGWADQQIPSGSSVEYYQRALNTMGGARQVQNSYRLFMVPGMGHCGGGDGPSTFDMLSALEQWVEKGSAPDRINASHMTSGTVDRTRPLCPYPQVAAYKGSGDTNDAANFTCR